MKKIITLILTVAAMTFHLSAMATGAIAVDDQVGDDEIGYGIATGEDSRSAAEREALKECRKAGNSNCKIAVWFEGCGAYAASRKYYGIGYGKTLKIAERKALEQCGQRSCEVKVSECDE
jgi:hypothetical protein